VVDDELTDGKRIGQLLSSEIHGRDRGPLGRLAVVDADPDAEPTADGSFAYAVADGEQTVLEAYLHPDRLRLEFSVVPEAAADAAAEAGLRARPKAAEPPRTLVFVERGAETKPALRVIERVVETRQERG